MHEGCCLMISWLCVFYSNLYDVFNNIRGDEEEHVKTMTACRDYSIVDDLAARKAARSRPGTKKSTPSANADTTQLQ